jgi:hypothetical protein
MATKDAVTATDHLDGGMVVVLFGLEVGLACCGSNVDYNAMLSKGYAHHTGISV